MKNFLLKHKIAAITVASVIIIAIISTIALIASGGITKNKPNEVAQQTVVGKAITAIVPEDKLGTYLTVPATDKWWSVIDNFNPTFQLDTIALSDIPVAPEMLGWSVSYSDNIAAIEQLGLNTTYLAFNNEADAEIAFNYITSLNQENFQVFTAKNVVIFIPMWAFSDIDYTVDAFLNASEQGTLETNEGNWTINYTEMQKIILSAAKDDSFTSVFTETLAHIGVNFSEATSDTYWTGESTDGINWTGTTSDKNGWSAESIDTNKIQPELEKTGVATMSDGSIKTMEEVREIIAEAEALGQSGDVIYIYDPVAEAALEYFTIESSTETFGTMRNYDGTYTEPEKVKEDNFVVFTVDPNAWIGYMTGQNASIPLVKYNQAEIKMYKNSDKVDITLTVAPWASEL
jgi:hypothetical protein